MKTKNDVRSTFARLQQELLTLLHENPSLISEEFDEDSRHLAAHFLEEKDTTPASPKALWAGSVGGPAVELDLDFRVLGANEAFRNLYGPHEGSDGARSLFEIGNRMFDVPGLREVLDRCISSNSNIVDFELKLGAADSNDRDVRINGWLVPGSDASPQRLLLRIENITQQHLVELARQQLAAIVETSDDAILSKTLDGIIISWNRAAERMYGFTAEEALGQPIAIIVPEEKRQELEEITAKLTRGETIAQRETLRQHKNGSLVRVSMTVSPMKNSDGLVVAASTIARDISTEVETKRRLRESERRAQERSAELQTLIDAVPIAVFVAHDPECRNMSGSRVASDLLRVKQGGNLSKSANCPDAVRHFRAFSEEQELSPDQLPVERAARGEDIRNFEFDLSFDDGSVRHLLGNAAPLFDDDGNPRGAIGAFLDITDRKEALEEIKRINTMLTIQAQRLTEANRELEAFSYSVSHDLRAPLRSIEGFSGALLEDCADRLNETGRDYLNRISSATVRMRNIIDGLLSLSRVSRAQVQRSDVNMSHLVKSICERLAATAPERTVKISIEPNVAGGGDPRLLEIALENLLSNAWKFTSKRADARIEFGTRQDDGECIYYVRDTGAGFDMTYADRLFLYFQRLHTETEFSGTGIGLPIVKRVIDKHGGRVWAEGKPDEGACFYFTLGERD